MIWYPLYSFARVATTTRATYNPRAACYLSVTYRKLKWQTKTRYTIPHNNIYFPYEVMYMDKLKRDTIIGLLFVLITGTLAHFLYGWTGKNIVAGLFTPVNESVWEHMKLIFFPMLLLSSVAIFLLKNQYPCISSAFYIGILIGTALIPILFYAYTAILNTNYLFLDIAVFFISAALAFFVSYKLTLSCKGKPYTLLSLLLVGVLFACFLIFTYQPPNVPLFLE